MTFSFLRLCCFLNTLHREFYTSYDCTVKTKASKKKKKIKVKFKDTLMYLRFAEA